MTNLQQFISYKNKGHDQFARVLFDWHIRGDEAS